MVEDERERRKALVQDERGCDTREQVDQDETYPHALCSLANKFLIPRKQLHEDRVAISDVGRGDGWERAPHGVEWGHSRPLAVLLSLSLTLWPSSVLLLMPSAVDIVQGRLQGRLLLLHHDMGVPVDRRHVTRWFSPHRRSGSWSNRRLR